MPCSTTWIVVGVQSVCWIPAVAEQPTALGVADCKDASSPASQSTAATAEPPCLELDGQEDVHSSLGREPPSYALHTLLGREPPSYARKDVDRYIADLCCELTTSLLQQCRLDFWTCACRHEITGSCIAQATLKLSSPEQLLQTVFTSNVGWEMVHAFEDKWGNYVMAAAIDHSAAVRLAILRSLQAKCRDREALACRLAGHKSACRCVMRLIGKAPELQGEAAELLQTMIQQLMSKVHELAGTQGGRLCLEKIIEHCPASRRFIASELCGSVETLIHVATRKFPSYVLDKLVTEIAPEDLDLRGVARGLVQEQLLADAHAFYPLKALVRRCVTPEECESVRQLRGELTARLALLPNPCLDWFFAKLLQSDRRAHEWKEDEKEKLRSMKHEIKVQKWQNCVHPTARRAVLGRRMRYD